MLRLSGGQGTRESPRVVVAAFGKHPAWDDHMEDLGLETDALVAAKRVLYVQGIAGNIDSGRWSELEARQLAIEFGHAFVWCRNDEVLAGRLWPSRDGRGRTRYPMIVCAYCRDVSVPVVYERVLPRLAELETKCRHSGSAVEIRALRLECQQELAGLLDVRVGSQDAQAARCEPASRLAGYPELGPDQEGLLRVLYHIDREITAGALPITSKRPCEHSSLARVPLSADRVPEAPILWTQFLLEQYGSRCGVLTLMPSNKTWLDLVVGEPTAAQLYCLRASLAAFPLTTAVPYKIGPQVTEKLKTRIVSAKVSAGQEQGSRREAKSREVK